MQAESETNSVNRRDRRGNRAETAEKTDIIAFPPRSRRLFSANSAVKGFVPFASAQVDC